IGWPWVEGRTDDPWELEAVAEPLDLGTVSPRPGSIVNVDVCPPSGEGVRRQELARAAGSVRAGLNRVELPPGGGSASPHCHPLQEELFVGLDGEGPLELTPSPLQAELGDREEEIPVRAGHIVARPAGTGIAHRFTGGPAGMTLLAYGTREPN